MLRKNKAATDWWIKLSPCFITDYRDGYMCVSFKMFLFYYIQYIVSVKYVQYTYHQNYCRNIYYVVGNSCIDLFNCDELLIMNRQSILGTRTLQH